MEPRWALAAPSRAGGHLRGIVSDEDLLARAFERRLRAVLFVCIGPFPSVRWRNPYGASIRDFAEQRSPR
eukprot:8995320-Lingulodinium_polyedra.AAC.1